MNTWFVELTFELSSDVVDGDFDTHFEDVLEAFDDMETIEDADGTISWADRRAYVTAAARGVDQLDVMARAVTGLRAAIHAVGGATQDGNR